MISDDVAAAVLDSLPSRVAVLGPDGTVVRLNDAWRRSAAAGLAIVPVRPGLSWLAACEAASQASAPLQTLAALTRRMLNARRDQARVEIPVSTPRGKRWMDVRIRPLSRGDGLVVVVDDVTDRHEKEVALRHRASYDPVTGLPGRSTVRDLIDAALGAHPTSAFGPVDPPGRARPEGRRPPSARASAAGTWAAGPSVWATSDEGPRGPTADAGSDAAGTAVLFLDIDGLHLVNRRFGYEVGDGTLRAAARRFQEVLGSDAIVGHWGGDQFVAAMTSTTSAAAASVANRLRTCLAEPVDVAGQQIPITVSVGLAFAGGVRSGHARSALPTGRATPEPAASHGPLAAQSDAEVLVRMAGDDVARARSGHRGDATAADHTSPKTSEFDNLS